MKYYYLDNYKHKVIDDEELDLKFSPGNRYTLIYCFKDEEFDDTITEIWSTANGFEKIRYLVLDKYHTNVEKERKRKLKGEPIYLKSVILPYSYFHRWCE